MKPYRFYSARKISDVPKNSLKNKHRPFQGSTTTVPTPSQILHPFYTPNYTEEFTLCFTERCPSLLNGKPIMPALVTDKVSSQSSLEMSSLKFNSVRGVSKWLEEFSSIRSNSLQSTHKLIGEKMIDELIRPSKLNKMKMPQITKLIELFGHQKSQRISSSTLNAITEQFVSDRELGIFSEDIYLYLLQHHVNSTDKIIAIIDSIRIHLNSDIDQFKVVESLVFQILLSVKRNTLPLTQTLIDSFDALLKEINHRFYLQDCTTQFQPIVCQIVLEYFIRVRKLNESKKIFSSLISRKFCPAEEVTVEYLQALNETLTPSKSHKDFLRVFALIHDLRPVFQCAQNPKIFLHLIPLCRHEKEVTSLLSIIKNAPNTKEILDVSLLSFISKIGHLKNEKEVTSANLCSLYRMVTPFYNHKLPEKFSRAFILSFAHLKNYHMMATIITKERIHVSGSFLESLFASLEVNERSTDSVQTSACSERFKRVFIQKYMVPAYLRLPVTSRLELIPQIKTPTTFSALLESEIYHSNAMQLDVLRKMLKYGRSKKLLSKLPRDTWDKILLNQQVVLVLDEIGFNTKTLLQTFNTKGI